ncbi:hypothetical protein K0U83_12135 [bacterium]|nr:hypothetical protein [bacterium]
MTALAANADRVAKNFQAPRIYQPIVEDAAEIYQGALVTVLVSSTYIVPAADLTGCAAAVTGVAQERVTGDDAKTCKVHAGVEYEFASSGLGQDNIGEDVAALDDNTVGLPGAVANAHLVGMLTGLSGTTATVLVGLFSGTAAT